MFYVQSTFICELFNLVDSVFKSRDITLPTKIRLVKAMVFPVVMLDHEKVDITMNNSPIRLIVGGRAKLARLANSHQVAISGRSVCRPRARIKVRL